MPLYASCARTDEQKTIPRKTPKARTRARCSTRDFRGGSCSVKQSGSYMSFLLKGGGAEAANRTQITSPDLSAGGSRGYTSAFSTAPCRSSATLGTFSEDWFDTLAQTFRRSSDRALPRQATTLRFLSCRTSLSTLDGFISCQLYAAILCQRGDFFAPYVSVKVPLRLPYILSGGCLADTPQGVPALPDVAFYSVHVLSPVEMRWWRHTTRLDVSCIATQLSLLCVHQRTSMSKNATFLSFSKKVVIRRRCFYACHVFNVHNILCKFWSSECGGAFLYSYFFSQYLFYIIR